MKENWPTFPNNNGHKGKKEFRLKRAYISWDDNDIRSSYDSENEESLVQIRDTRSDF